MDTPSTAKSTSSSRVASNARDFRTLILARADIAPLMSYGDYVHAIECGFRASAAGLAQSPPPLHVHASDGGFHAKAALLESAGRFVAVKINSNFPGNPRRNNLPTIQGVVTLFDAQDGRLIAIMDSIEITLQRTAAASALAARFLVRRDATTLTICGCGEQARAQLVALAANLPLRKTYAWDLNAERARAFAAGIRSKSRLDVEAVESMREATLRSDVIVTSTTAREPFLGTDDVRPGAFVAAIGADNREKNEVTPDLMRRSSVFVDVLEQCLTMGDLHHAVAAGAMTANDVKADLADLVSGRRAGRTSEEEVTIFDSTGTAIEDVATAIAIYERAAAAGVGMRVDLGN